MTDRRWVLHCTLCDSPVFKSVVMCKPKVGEPLAWQQWFHMDYTPTRLGEDYYCRHCENIFQPVIQKVFPFHD